MSAQHTPGPWRVSPFNAFEVQIEVQECEYVDIAHTDCDGTPRNECTANARLIAVAPELLEMLKQIENSEYGYGIGPTHAQILALIAKAEGNAS